MTVEANDLLTYLPEFQVLICRTCRFAVQPKALSSHLLRHQIYRSERRKLLERLKTYKLVEPEQIRTPLPDTPPLPHLPVYHGYKCNEIGCGHCFTSKKRMCQHWSEQHYVESSRLIDASPACLQTFFRGNKIHYFEVSAPFKGLPCSLDSEEDGTPAENGSQDTNMSDSQSHTHGTNSTEPALRQFEPSPIDESQGTPIPSLNMQNLRYLHTYTISTGRTVTRGHDPPEFWTPPLPQLALEYDFLMHAILSTAAFHCAHNSLDDPITAHQHRKAALQLHSAALSGFRTAIAKPTRENGAALIAASRLIGIQSCIQMRLDMEANILDPATTSATAAADSPFFPVLEFVLLIRGGFAVILCFQHLLPAGSALVFPEQVKEGLRDMTDEQKHWTGPLPPRSRYPDLPAAMYDHLAALPDTLFGVLPPEDGADGAVVLPAMLALLECYARSYASEEVWALWNAIETWARVVSDQFLGMLEAGRPAALTVFAHWCVLIRRLREHYWFMGGLVTRLVRIVLANLDGEIADFVKTSIEYLWENR